MAKLIADIHEASSALRASGTEIAKSVGVTLIQWHVMDAVDSASTVARIARRVGFSRQAVQTVANDLVARGLVEFVPNPDHKTSPLLRITDDGLAVKRRIWAAAKDSHDRRFGDLDPEALATTGAVLRAMTEATNRDLA